MIKRVKKPCDGGCNQDQYIWKNHSGKRYCISCWNKKSPPVKIPVTTSIKKVSEKRKKENIEYSSLRKYYLSRNKWCQINLPGCTGEATDIHHLYSGKNRSKYYLIMSTWKSTCRNCHDIIHNNLSATDAIELELKLTE